MDTCFAVLWIPTINHTPIPFESPLHNGIRTINISDDPSSDFTIRVEEKRKNIIISIKDEEGDSFSEYITLKFEDYSHNGLLKYSFPQTRDRESGFDFDGNNFPEAVYHLIKSFYHTHDFHEDESDSSLPPYTCCHNVNIHRRNNEALRHYLDEYETNICKLVKKAHQVVRHAIDIEKHGITKDADTHNDKLNDIIRKDYESFFHLYVMGVGSDAYLSSLYESTYNSSYLLSSSKRELRRKAFNIKNAVKYLNVLYAFFDTKIRQENLLTVVRNAEATLKNSEASLKSIQTNLNTTETNLNKTLEGLRISQATLGTAQQTLSTTSKDSAKSAKIAWWTFGVSIVIAVISLIYSINSSNSTETQIESIKQSIKAEQDKMLDSIKTLDKRLKPEAAAPVSHKGK